MLTFGEVLVSSSPNFAFIHNSRLITSASRFAIALCHLFIEGRWTTVDKRIGVYEGASKEGPLPLELGHPEHIPGTLGSTSKDPRDGSFGKKMTTSKSDRNTMLLRESQSAELSALCWSILRLLVSEDIPCVAEMSEMTFARNPFTILPCRRQFCIGV